MSGGIKYKAIRISWNRDIFRSNINHQ